MNCPHCNGALVITAAQVNGTQVPPSKVEVDVAWLRNTCNLLLASPNCTDKRHREALESFPAGAEKYNGTMTAGQWKFFSVIHSQVFGTWPEKPGSTEKSTARTGALSQTDLDSAF